MPEFVQFLVVCVHEAAGFARLLSRPLDQFIVRINQSIAISQQLPNMRKRLVVSRDLRVEVTKRDLIAIGDKRPFSFNLATQSLEFILGVSSNILPRLEFRLVASFQRAIVEDLVGKTLAAARAYDVATLFVTGGVAANQELRQTFGREGAKQGLPVYFPSRPLSTDNAAMIAAAAYPKFLLKDFAAMDFSAEAGLLLR